MNPTPNEPQPEVTSSETTPSPTDITPALDFYNRECAGLTLPEYIARRIKNLNPVEGMLLAEWQLAKLIALAIAEYEKAHSIATVILTGGAGYTVHPVVTCTDADGKPVALAGSKYRMLKGGEKIQEGDEYDRRGTWLPVISGAVGAPLFQQNVGHFRRRLTPNEPQPEAPTP